MSEKEIADAASVHPIVHTPGPWEQYDDWYIRMRGGRGSIAAVGKPIDPQISDGECMANARLIAAAPELLSAVKAFIECWESGSFLLQGAEVMEMLRNARSKAVGL